MGTFKDYIEINQKTKRVKFIGDRLDIFIPMKYSEPSMNVLNIGDEIETLAIFEMVINNSIECGYYLPALITIVPSEILYITHNGESCLQLILYKDDVFMKSTRVDKNQGLAYLIFKEFIDLGNQPGFIKYMDSAFMFDDVEKVNGVNFRVDHSIFEIMMSNLYRDPADISTLYRNTTMSGLPLRIGLNQVAQAATSTTSKIVGAYMDAGINSALVNQVEEPSTIENILRM